MTNQTTTPNTDSLSGLPKTPWPYGALGCGEGVQQGDSGRGSVLRDLNMISYVEIALPFDA